MEQLASSFHRPDRDRCWHNVAGQVDRRISKLSPTVPIYRGAPGGPAQAGCGRRGWRWPKYMVRTEVHTYAFSVAANVILSLFPFIVMMLTLSARWSTPAPDVVVAT